MTRKRPFDPRTGDYVPAINLQNHGGKLIRRERDPAPVTVRQPDPLIRETWDAIDGAMERGAFEEVSRLVQQLPRTGPVAAERYAEACLRSGMTLEQAENALAIAWVAAGGEMDVEGSNGDGR